MEYSKSVPVTSLALIIFAFYFVSVFHKFPKLSMLHITKKIRVYTIFHQI